MGSMKILFVCLGNSYRSPVAEALLKKIRPDVDADSAGMHPTIPISKEAEKYLAREEAEEYLKGSPEDLGSKQLREYDLIVAMKKEHRDAVLRSCPECGDKVVVWNIDDPYFLPQGCAQKVFRQIKEKVLELASSL